MNADVTTSATDTLSFAIASNVATLADTQTLQNKTLRILHKIRF